MRDLGTLIVAKCFKSYPKAKKLPNLVTLVNSNADVDGTVLYSFLTKLGWSQAVKLSPNDSALSPVCRRRLLVCPFTGWKPHFSLPSSLCWSVWPDLAKFRHFGKNLQVFGKLLTVRFFFGKMLSLLWQICDITGRFSLWQMAKYWNISQPSGHTAADLKRD